jgi:hypothetical protein
MFRVQGLVKAYAYYKENSTLQTNRIQYINVELDSDPPVISRYSSFRVQDLGQ